MPLGCNYIYSECKEGLFECTEKNCDVDCIVSLPEPSNCSEECGVGVQYGIRKILAPTEYNGAPCPPAEELELELGECYAGDCGEFWTQ